MDPRTRRKEYAAPELSVLGTVEELTRQIDKCTGSADATLPREVPNAEDFTCGPF